MHIRPIFAVGVALVLSASLLIAAEVMPPKPAGYFNDYANVVSKEKALALNEKLAQFERETSNQVLVAVFRKMETDSDIADYTRRIAETWKVGQADKRNGAVLFVFVDDRKMFIQVGYGLEGALPDLTAFDITERHIKPRFRTGDYAGGLEEGVDLMQKAILGEYKGDGRTVREKSRSTTSNGAGALGFIIMLIIVLAIMRLGRRRGGYGYSGFGGPFISSGWGSGGGWSGGSSSSSGGGFSGFSGGGGSFGGGGAGSDW
ncbi:MAG TPA: TPM domain-containing protein [Chthoniobacterales bacterium]|nr:TPM domain-containing protein [Chthoniobacterales bacterium]